MSVAAITKEFTDVDSIVLMQSLASLSDEHLLKESFEFQLEYSTVVCKNISYFSAPCEHIPQARAYVAKIWQCNSAAQERKMVTSIESNLRPLRHECLLITRATWRFLYCGPVGLGCCSCHKNGSEIVTRVKVKLHFQFG